MKHKYLLLIYFLSLANLKAQVGFGTNSPVTSSVVEMYSQNKGFLIPQVALQGVGDITTIPNPVNALTIYNVATAGVGNNMIIPGYYYFEDNTKRWVRLGEAIPAWNLLGNGGTNANVNFIGTITNEDLVFKRNNLNAGILNNAKQNTAFGFNALNNARDTTIGAGNTAIGYESLLKNTSGEFNFAFGVQALSQNTIGSHNISLGYQSLYKSLNAYSIIAFGTAALYNNNSNGTNLAQGYMSLASNTNGVINYAFGTESLQKNLNGGVNIGVGYQALKNHENGDQNIAIGHQSLLNDKTGGYNVSVGYLSSSNNHTGQRNTATGNYSLQNSDKYSNSAIGHKSLQNSNGDNNIAMGFEAGIDLNGAGERNLALGANTKFPNSSGSHQMNIANNIFGTSLAAGDRYTLAGSKIGIGTATPNSTLHVSGSMATNIRVLTSADNLVLDNDYTVLLESNAILPTPSIANIGRMYYLVNNNGGNYNIGFAVAGNYFKELQNDFSSYPINNSNGSKGLLIQSDGLSWIILAKD